MKTVDEGLAPVRAVRHAISQEFGHDPQRYMEYLKTQEKRYAKQIEAFDRRHASRSDVSAKRSA